MLRLWCLVIALTVTAPLLSAEGPAKGPASELGKLLTKKPKATKPRSLEPAARLTGFSSWVTSLAFRPDDRQLAIGLKDSVQLVDPESRAVQREITVKVGQVRALAYSPDGKLLVIAGYQKCGLWNPDNGQLVRELNGHRGYVTGVAWSPDGQRLVTGCEDEAARVWDLSSEAPVQQWKGLGLPVNGVAWSPDGRRIAAAIGDDLRPTRSGKVLVWEAQSGEVAFDFDLHAKSASGVAFSADGRYLASTSLDEHVNIYDLNENKPLGFYGGHSRPTNAIVFHPDEESALSISGGRAVGMNELKVWDFRTGDDVAGSGAHEARIGALALAHHGRLAATGSQDNTVALWNVGFLSVSTPATGRGEATGQIEPADALAVLAQTSASPAAAEPKTLRAGIIGLDTSHAIAFTKTLNAANPPAAVAGCRLVAAYPKGSPDIASSVSRVPGYTEEMKKLGVEIVPSIEDLLTRVDVVFLETNDGRPHFEQLIPVLKAGKPCFIDKPIAASLSDAIAIFEASRKYKVPVFSSSSLRFGKSTLAVRGGSIGAVQRCETSSPASLEPSHPDLFWYGIHGVESLFTVMKTGCRNVTRDQTDDGKIRVTGEWPDGRIGVFQEGKGYTGTATGENGTSAVGSYDGYDPLLFAIVEFFRTGKSPVTEEETLEIYAFMEAADESVRQGGAKVSLDSVMTKARDAARQKIDALK